MMDLLDILGQWVDPSLTTLGLVVMAWVVVRLFRRLERYNDECIKERKDLRKRIDSMRDEAKLPCGLEVCPKRKLG